MHYLRLTSFNQPNSILSVWSDGLRLMCLGIFWILGLSIFFLRSLVNGMRISAVGGCSCLAGTKHARRVHAVYDGLGVEELHGAKRTAANPARSRSAADFSISVETPIAASSPMSRDSSALYFPRALGAVAGAPSLWVPSAARRSMAW